MSYCIQCGDELGSKDSFCSKCGLKIDAQKKLDPTNLPEIEKKTLNNLKNAQAVAAQAQAKSKQALQGLASQQSSAGFFS